jgi:hypothetical protein
MLTSIESPELTHQERRLLALFRSLDPDLRARVEEFMVEAAVVCADASDEGLSTSPEGSDGS